MKATLPPEERERVEQTQEQREQLRQEMANLTPEQRRERFSQMGGGGGREQQRVSRIKNSTPEQRVERYRQFAERRQRWQRQGPSR